MGEIPGPTLYVAGPALTKGGNANAVQTWNVSGADRRRGKTRQLIDEGVDWIKILNAEQLAPEEMTAIVSEAHAHGRKVAAHAFSDGEIRQGLRAGVDDFQHLRTQAPIYPPDIVEMIRDRVKSGPPLYWTITAGGNGQLNAAYLASNPEFLDDPANFVGLPQPIVDDVRKAIAARTRGPAATRGSAVQSQEEINATVKRKVAQIRGLGVEIVFGTDVGSWGEVTGAGGMDGGRSLGPRARHGSDDGHPLDDARRGSDDGRRAGIGVDQRRKVRGRHRRTRRSPAEHRCAARPADCHQARAPLQIRYRSSVL